MARPIDKVLKARLDGRRHIHVPEWDLDLYFSTLTTNDMIAVADRMKEEGRDAAANDYERRIVLLIQKAELEDGTKAFTFGDRMALMESADWDVLQRVVAFMYRSALSVTSSDEAKKKSETKENSEPAS